VRVTLQSQITAPSGVADCASAYLDTSLRRALRLQLLPYGHNLAIEKPMFVTGSTAGEC